MDIVVGKKRQDGSVLLVALLFMIMLTLIGTTAMNTSTTEQLIAANDKFHKITFQNADSGIYTTPKIISGCLASGSETISPTPNGISVLDANGDWVLMGGGDGTFYREMMGYVVNDADTDVRIVLGNNPVEVDIQRVGTETLAGGGAEFGTGAEGLGSGTTGSSAIRYRMDSTGNGPAESISRVVAVYRKILGVPGGL